MKYWPGTNIPMSTNNAFTSWKTGDRSQITTSRDWRMSEIATKNTAGTGMDKRKQFTIYSRAKASQ